MQRSRILPAFVLLLLVLLIGFSIFHASSEPGRQTLMEITRWFESNGRIGLMTLTGTLILACIFGIPPASLLLMAYFMEFSTRGCRINDGTITACAAGSMS